MLWASLGLLVWTHVGYPLLAAVVARLFPRAVRCDGRAADGRARDRGAQRGGRDRGQARERAAPRLPARAAAHHRRLATPRATAPTRSCAAYADRGVELSVCPRGGKVNAQNVTVRGLDSDDPRVLGRELRVGARTRSTRLVRVFGDPEVAYVCGRLRLQTPRARTRRGSTGATSCGCARRSRACTRSPAATARSTPCAASRYEEVDPRFGHDLSFPYLMVKRGRRAVYVSRRGRQREDDHRPRGRVPPQGADVRALLDARAQGADVRPARARPGLLASRWSRTACCATRAALLHIALLAHVDRARARATAASTGGCSAPQVAAAARGARLALARGRVRLLAVPHYYLLVTAATVIALFEVATQGVPPVLGQAGGHAMSAATT